jgi:hypothetical protein
MQCVYSFAGFDADELAAESFQKVADSRQGCMKHIELSMNGVSNSQEANILNPIRPYSCLMELKLENRYFRALLFSP